MHCPGTTTAGGGDEVAGAWSGEAGTGRASVCSCWDGEQHHHCFARSTAQSPTSWAALVLPTARSSAC